MADVWSAPGPVQNTSTNPDTSERFAKLVQHTLEDAKELVRAELSLARSEVEGELKAALLSLSAGAIAVVLLHTALLVLVAALIVALGGDALTILLIGLALVLLAVAGASVAVLFFVRRHLPRTRERIARDANLLRMQT
jgi:Flp pilus assembly protein TadB